MSRKAPPDIDDELVAALEAEDTDQHGFWDGPTLDLEALDLAFAVDGDTEEPDGARETLVYMGSVPQTQVDDQELTALADWAESKACRACRTASREQHDAPLQHEGCRQALRASTLLRRYN